MSRGRRSTARRRHHLAARTDTVDFQVWVADGDKPLPQRVVITYKKAKGEPQFWAQFSDWNLAPAMRIRHSAAKPPDGAQKGRICGPASARVPAAAKPPRTKDQVMKIPSWCGAGRRSLAAVFMLGYVVRRCARVAAVVAVAVRGEGGGRCPRRRWGRLLAWRLRIGRGLLPGGGGGQPGAAGFQRRRRRARRRGRGARRWRAAWRRGAAQGWRRAAESGERLAFESQQSRQSAQADTQAGRQQSQTQRQDTSSQNQAQRQVRRARTRTSGSQRGSRRNRAPSPPRRSGSQRDSRCNRAPSPPKPPAKPRLRRRCPAPPAPTMAGAGVAPTAGTVAMPPPDSWPGLS